MYKVKYDHYVTEITNTFIFSSVYADGIIIIIIIIIIIRHINKLELNWIELLLIS